MAETSPIELCFICDDGYVMPTAVAIQSLKENGTGGRRCRVHIVAADLSEESEAVLRGMSDGEMSVTVVRASAQELASLHVPQEGGMCVATPAALLKFSLGELLPDLDKVLYLDGDILVRKNLAPIFDLDLGEKVLAAAPDTGVISFPRPIHAEVKRYFNSGVMLLNLKKMRAEDYAARLVAAKRGDSERALMDQDVFNRVCDGKALPLPPRANCLLVNLARAFGHGLFAMADFNRRFGTDYRGLAAFGEDALLVHFSSKDKPWFSPDVPFAGEWMRVFERTPFAWHPRSIKTIGLVYHGLGKGGIERSASFQLPMFRRMGLRVVAFTDTDTSAEDYANGGDFDRVSLSAFAGDPVAHARALHREIRRRKVELLIHHDAYVPARLRHDVRAARTAGAAVAVFWNNVFSHFLIRPGRQLETKALFDACREVTAMLTLTKTDEAFFRMLGHPSFAMPFSDPDLLAGFTRREWPHRIIWLGRLVEQKQPIHAFRIFEKVRERVPDSELVVLGDGDADTERELAEWLKSRPAVASSIRMEGFRKDVRPFLEACGVGLVTSRFEGYCHSIVEMKMAAMPVVSYSMPYLDTLKPDSGAICVPQGEVGAAADAIVRLFGDPDEWRRQGARARRSYEELASVDEEGNYERLLEWLKSGAGDEGAAISPRYARFVVETFVEHAHAALEIMDRTARGETDRAVREEWTRDRSYRLGRFLTWPYRTAKRIWHAMAKCRKFQE